MVKIEIVQQVAVVLDSGAEAALQYELYDLAVGGVRYGRGIFGKPKTELRDFLHLS